MSKQASFEVNEDTPVLMVFDPEGYIISAGHPSYLSKKEAFSYFQSGCTSKTVKFYEFKAMDKKWIWDKAQKCKDNETTGK